MSIQPDAVPRIESYLAGELEVVRPRPAATVILLREGPDGLETLLLHRPPTMAFAPAVYAFPGGSVDRGDADPVASWAGPPPETWSAALSCPPPQAAALVCAGVRETLEESGILLADPADGTQITSGGIAVIHAALTQQQQALPAALNACGWRLRADLLRPWTRWVTPGWSPRRFDTLFLIGTVPGGQHPVPTSAESDETAWYPVRAALDGYRDGTLRLMLPAAHALREVTAYPDLAAILATWREPATFQPRPVRDASGLRLTVRGPAGDSSPEELTS